MKKFLKQQNLSISRPWTMFYDDGVPKSLDYPDLMLWEFIRKSANSFPNKA